MRGCAMKTRTYQQGGWTITEETGGYNELVYTTATGTVPQSVTTTTMVRND